MVKKVKKITKSMTFTKILEVAPELVEALLERGMHCIGCPMSTEETLEQGAQAHGIDPDELVKELNKELSKS